MMKRKYLYLLACLLVVFAFSCTTDDEGSIYPPDYIDPSLPVDSVPTEPTEPTVYNYIAPTVGADGRIEVLGTPVQYTDTAKYHVISVAYDITTSKSYDLNTYYADAIGKKGDELRDALAAIIAEDAVKLSYTPGIWDLTKEADQNPLNEDEVWLAYTEVSRAKTEQQGSGTSVGKWNREHTWAKSHGLGDTGTPGPSTDGHNLRAEDSQVNTSRSNRDFVEGDNAEGWGTVGSEGFYPKVSSRGDVARILMYMAVRWNEENSIALDNLVSTSGNRTGKLDDLIKWHSVDPVDPYEIRRNNVVFKHQKNRNPFVDHPELVDFVFGDKQDQAWDGGIVYSLN